MKTQYIGSLVILLLFLKLNMHAQLQGKVDYPSLGISFTIPSEWQGQESDEGVILTSYTVAGLSIISTHNHNSVEAMKSEAQIGLVDDAGTNMQLEGSIDQISTTSIGGTYIGTLEYQEAKAYYVGVVNSNGLGISIITITSSTEYQKIHEETSRKIAKSVNFYTPKVSAEAKEWTEAFSNVKLTYMNSYSSSGGTGYGSYSDKTIIDLCASGYFSFYSNSQVAIDVDGGSGYSHDGDDGQGTWKVVSDRNGNSILQLTFNSGEISEYTLTYDDSKIFLNGSRYFRGYGEEGARCD